MQTEPPKRVFARPIDRSEPDCLSAFLTAIDVSVSLDVATAAHHDSKLLIVLTSPGYAARLIFFTQGPMEFDPAYTSFVMASIQFGNMTNPLVNALPDQVAFNLTETPELHAISNAFVYEATQARCGHEAAILRLGELLVLMVLRHVMQSAATGPGLFAGLAHPALYRSLTAMHNDPARAWKIEILATLAGMSRSRFMAVFRATLGTTPAVYLTDWRLMLARRALLQGRRIKSIAAMVGFSSAEALSRAYSRKFGHAPAREREYLDQDMSKLIATPGQP